MDLFVAVPEPRVLLLFGWTVSEPVTIARWVFGPVVPWIGSID